MYNIISIEFSLLYYSNNKKGLEYEIQMWYRYIAISRPSDYNMFPNN